MTVAAPASGQAMTWEQFETLGDDVRAEYVDGRLLVTPSPSGRHQDVSLNLALALRAVLPAPWRVREAWGWKPGTDLFVPDVMVYPRTDERQHLTGTPALVVEILSSDRAHDLVTKSGKYAAAGLERYWVVDADAETLDAYLLTDGVYEPAARVTRDTPADVDLGVATLHVDLAVLGRD